MRPATPATSATRSMRDEVGRSEARERMMRANATQDQQRGATKNTRSV